MPSTDARSYWPATAGAAILLLAMLSLPLLGRGALGALGSTSNDPRQWLPRRFEETNTYDWFQQHFGGDEVAVASWPNCSLDDPRVERLARGLESSAYYDRTLTGPRVLQQLLAEPVRLTRNQALRRLSGVLVGADGVTTCVVAVTSGAGQADRTAAVRQIVEEARACGIAADDLRLAGPTVDAAAIDAESRRLLFQLAGVSAAASFILATLRLRSIRLALLVLAAACYCTALALAIVYFSGGRMNLLMTMLPPLVYVLTISAAVHLVNYYRDAVRETGLGQAVRRALGHGWLPCVVAAGTTAVGLASLATSAIDPIREFGIYAATGVLLSVVVLLVLLPAALVLFPPGSVRWESSEARTVRRAARLATRYARFIGRHHAAIAVIGWGLIAFFGWGLTRVGSTVKLQDRFLPSSDILADYGWLERHVGPMVPLEVVVGFDSDCPLSFLERMQLIEDVERQIAALETDISTMSAASFAPSLSRGRGGLGATMRRAVLNRRLLSSRQSLVDAGYLAEDGERQLWRISVRAPALSQLDYGRFSETLRRQTARQLDLPFVHATYTGVIPLIYKAQRHLLSDLVKSFFAAFVVIAVVMTIVLRSVPAALLAMLPNLFPAIVIFGGMGWLSILVQIGSVMTASAALGIAVDDTIHFLTWFRRSLGEGQSRAGALRDAFRRCAGAMIHTTVICAGGLIVFLASSFVPILHFAGLMVGLLLAALLGDLVLLPAMLAGPLGRFFQPPHRRAHAERAA